MNIRTQHYNCCEAGMRTKIAFIPAINILWAPMHLPPMRTPETTGEITALSCNAAKYFYEAKFGILLVLSFKLPV